MSYTLQHTAEEIDNKLDLINENINLLKYPYEPSFSDYSALEDVGDGTILVTKDIESDININLLSDFSLPRGKKYWIQFIVTDDILGENIITRESGCELKINNDIIITNWFYPLTVPEETNEKEQAISVSLKIPVGTKKGWMIRLQIEEQIDGQSMNNLVPYMDNIGAYVDRRFNSTNAKIKATKEYIDSLILSTLNNPV